MRRFVLIYIWLTGDFQPILSEGLKDTPTLGNTKTNPRVLSKDMFSAGFEYQIHQNHTVFLYEEDSHQLYVGGTDFVLRLTVPEYRIIEEFPLKTTEQQCQEGPCKTVVTVIEKFKDKIFVCATDEQNPQCWKLPHMEESYDGHGISPFVHTQNSLLLTIDGDIYAAAPLDADGSSLQFRRKAGSRTNVWMYDSWVSEPTFISASLVQRKVDPDNEKIYIFFREKNSDPSPEADPWISRVARVCKVDEGGSKRFFQNIWTSFLKARLVCGFPDESLYFNRLQDIYVMHAEHWPDTRVYALFTSSWNSTAVCIYTISMIEEVFENSTFKGYNKDIPRPRPGTCVPNSRSLPQATLNVVKDYPEMTDWVHSVHNTAPFYISSNNYTKIVVDQVQAADKRVYNILLLATDTGKIHKVLEAGSEPFIISETHLSNSSTIQAMKLDSKKKMLVVGFSEKISTMDLQRCQDYNNSCADCVLARDPYCAWTLSGCTSATEGGVQSIMDGQISVCSAALQEQMSAKRIKRESTSPSAVNSKTEYLVPEGVPFYLSCPIDSYHAEYTWEYGDQRSPCLQMLSDCLHLIPSMTKENYGNYKCVSKEKDYTKVVKRYRLKEQHNNEITPRSRNPFRRNEASALVPRVWITLIAAALWGMFR